MLAAHALRPHFDGDQLRFIQAGGSVAEAVDLDQTELAVSGLSANLDILLSGLSATLHEGTYDVDSIRTAVARLDLTTGISPPDRVAVNAWRAARYGADQLPGHVDADRASEVFALATTRIAQLHVVDDERASRFVSARRHLLARIRAVDTRASSLADRAVDDVARAPVTPEEVRVLTIDGLVPMLANLELAHALIMLRGPDAAVATAYRAPGREPITVE